jgi:transcriptional regulator with XRE-family HTH domain
MEQELCLGLSRGEIDVREATRRMRKILGMSQKTYAQRIAGISPRILAELESGSGNPTLATLEKIAAPFGMKVTFRPPDAWQGMGERVQASRAAPGRSRPVPARPKDGRLAGRR